MKKVFSVFLCILIISSSFLAVSADERSFEQITDAFMENALKEDHVAGAVVSVVKDGTILFEKGYGFADLEKHIPVNPNHTTFQIASVSKLFTATAAMQLIEQGKLSLDEDINHYLTAFQIENPYNIPVTLRTLLTHTSGIDDRMPLYTPSSGNILFKDMPPLETVLKDNLAPVVHKPGTLCQYNVFGMALVGYLVELASNMPLDQYIEQNIFTPLDMRHSSYGLTDKILPYMSKPYHHTNSGFSMGTYTVINDHPSGSICASGADMGKFMLAHLNNKLLSPETELLMQSHQVPEEDRLTGYGLGFYETVRNGHRTIEHGGYLPSFCSKLSLLPEKNLGVFLSLNTKSKTSNRIPNEYIDLFYKHFTRNNQPVPQTISFDKNAKELSGQYSGSYGITDFTKIKSVLEICKIECDENGTLTYSGEGETWKFTYVDDDMFYCKENGNYLRLSKQSGEWILTVLGHDYKKVSNTDRILFLLTVASLPFFLLSFLVLCIFVIRRKQGVPLLLLSLLIIAYMALNICIPFFYAAGNTGSILCVIKPFIPIICYLGAAMLIFSATYVVRIWKNKKQHLIKRIWFSLIVLIALPCMLFMFFMNGFVF